MNNPSSRIRTGHGSCRSSTTFRPQPHHNANPEPEPKAVVLYRVLWYLGTGLTLFAELAVRCDELAGAYISGLKLIWEKSKLDAASAV